MVRRHFPEPEAEPCMRLQMPVVPDLAAVVGTAAEVLLAGQVAEPEPIVTAIRAAAETLIGQNTGDGQIELVITRTGRRLALSVPATGRARAGLGRLADHLERTRGRLTLVWDLARP